MKMFEENLNLKASQHLASTHEAMQAQQAPVDLSSQQVWAHQTLVTCESLEYHSFVFSGANCAWAALRTLTTRDSGLFHDTTPISPESSTCKTEHLL